MGESINDGTLASAITRVARQKRGFPEAIAAAFDVLNDEIRTNRALGAHSRIEFFALARVVLALAVSETDRARVGPRKEPSQKDGIAWRMLTAKLQVLRDEIGHDLIKCLGDDELRKFVRFESRSKGTEFPRFYVSLALLVVRLHEEGCLTTERFVQVAADSDRGLPQRIRRVVDDILARVEGHADPLHVAAAATTEAATFIHKAPGIQLNFLYEPGRLEALEAFQRNFRFGKDECAHFVVYRPSRSDPRFLVKSFLALKSPVSSFEKAMRHKSFREKIFDRRSDGNGSDATPEVGDTSGISHVRDIFNFRHIYCPPEGTNAPNRESVGWAVPLTEGLYLIGGHRKLHEHAPFSALKVIALPWTSIDSGEQLMRGFTISTNSGRLQVASRIALRATPIGHSRDLSLGLLHTDNLLADLTADAMKESDAQASAIQSHSFGRDHRVFAAWYEEGRRNNLLKLQAPKILQYCNNAPRRPGAWEMSQGFKVNDRPLDRHFFEQQLRKLEAGDTSFKRETPDGNEMFRFWTALRVGPLTHED